MKLIQLQEVWVNYMNREMLAFSVAFLHLLIRLSLHSTIMSYGLYLAQ